MQSRRWLSMRVTLFNKRQEGLRGQGWRWDSSCQDESGSELVLLPGAWDWQPDSKSPSKMLSFTSLMLPCSCMVVLLLGHSGCAWDGQHCKGAGSQSRQVTAVSGRLRSGASAEPGDMRAWTWMSPLCPSLLPCGRLSSELQRFVLNKNSPLMETHCTSLLGLDLWGWQGLESPRKA